MKVMLLAIASKHTEAGRPPTKEAVLAMHQFNEELEKAGVLLDLGGLTPTSRGARVTYRAGKTAVVDGPFAEAKEVVAGYSLLEVKSLAEAIEWAKRAPFGVGMPEGAEAVVEIRPLFDASDFDPGKGV
ncbi:MAG: YciI family protein [Deltaproteobacteria bacterium]|nr:YciI family protein [Deltaproteobacteria bacterium]